MTQKQVEGKLRFYLQKYFGHDSFQEGQKEIIEDVLAGHDVLGILRTGSGKSLCYQLPAKMLSGTTVVVSPLISLMVDQVRQVRAFHYKEAIAFHSFQNKPERAQAMNNMHRYKLVYVSPELLLQKGFIRKLKNIKISLIVIDEAHCISQWGYDFRPDYLRLSSVIDMANRPPVLALTGTATPEVQEDIKEKLNRPAMKEHIYPMDRENISLVIHEVDGEEADKRNTLASVIDQYAKPTIVYFSSRQMTEDVASFLSERIKNRKIAHYHGGMDNMDRLKIQQQFMKGQLDVICCTSAFGMGINKNDIRLIVHYHMPAQMESFIQEIGRAGRDGKDSVSLLLYKKGDEHVPLHIIENELPTKKEISLAINQLYLLHETKQALPKADEKIEKLFQIDMTKWRLLNFHFESHGMIKNGEILFDEAQWKEALKAINEFSSNRTAIKRKQLNEMIDWLHSKTCLRVKLYEGFGQSIRRRESQCCSNCGFSFKRWLRESFQMETQELEKSNWQEQLKTLLLIGDKDETS